MPSCAVYVCKISTKTHNYSQHGISFHRVTISSHAISPKISGFANQVRAKIVKEVEGNMVSVMVDGCSKGRRHFVGINVQFVKEGKHVVRTLAVEELHINQTGANLKQVIPWILRKYAISPKNVVSFTSDNGPNYILAGKLMAFKEVHHLEFEGQCEEVPWAELDIEISHGDFQLQIVRCAAHTLQLAVDDALKLEKVVQDAIAAVKELAKFLRNPNNADKLKENGHPIPLLDVPTRWGSTFDMLVSVAKLRNFLEYSMTVSAKDKVYLLTDEQWKVVEEAIKDLDPVRKATTRLQASSLTLGQFMAIWMGAVMKLKKRVSAVGSSLAKNLVKFMEERSNPAMYKDKRKGRAGQEKLSSLFNYPSFNAAVHLDPRYFTLLTPEQVADAKSYLLGLWTRLQAVRGVALLPEGPEDEDDPEAVGSDSNSDGDDDFTKLLAQKNRARLLTKWDCERQRAQPTTARTRISKHLNEYDETVCPLPESADVLLFWEGQQLIWPELTELARVVLAIPATQVSVERLFSALRFILRPQRFNLSEANVDDIVFLHANRDLVQELATELLCKVDFVGGEADGENVSSTPSTSSSSLTSPPE